MQKFRTVSFLNRRFSHLAICALFGLLLALPAFGAIRCEIPFEIPQEVLDRQVVILGELHGTRETPEFTGEYGCLLAQGLVEVILALEIPEREQQFISAYLSTLGSSADLNALTRGAFWNRPELGQDGRSSQAMLQLIERVRVLRYAGKRISIAAIDGQRPGLKRDGSMAQIIRDLLKSNPQTRVIALVGNAHALKNRGANFRSDYESLGFLLSDLSPLTLTVLPKQGTAWVCIDNCGPTKLGLNPWAASRSPGIYLGSGPINPAEYHGTIVLERAEASPPARSQ